MNCCWINLTGYQELKIKAASFLFLLITATSFTSASMATPAEDMAQFRQLAQLAEYIGVDYSNAVVEGQIADVSEYQEMIEFSNLLVSSAQSLVDTKSGNQTVVNQRVVDQATKLLQAVKNVENADRIGKLSAEVRNALLKLMPQISLPKHLLPTAKTNALFREKCSSCHGLSGQGDGPLAAQLAPEPTNFLDKERAKKRSILGLFDAISNGISATAMPSFTHLSELQRWSLAFYVGSLAFQPTANLDVKDLTFSLHDWVNNSPAQLAAKVPNEKAALVEWFRATPASLFVESQSPLAVTRKRLLEAVEANHKENYSKAANLSVSAYLDGFELIENSLDVHNSDLRKSIEVNLMTLRRLLASPQTGNVLENAVTEVLHQLDEADRLLAGPLLSSGTLFSASLLILLREGLEALLIVIALVTVLVKTGRKDALKYVHFGWISALVAGGATWAAAQSLISISGASREVMEGVAALFAALVLLYVGIWMHSKTHAANWQAYIQKHVNANLKSGTLWGLSALAFIAVYREVFETVLFYEALLTQAVTTQYYEVAGGFLLGVIILAVFTWVFTRYSIKLPIGKFFATTTYLLLGLSFVLMGKAVIALQEAAVIGITQLPVNFEFDWIGMKSTWQGILAQIFVLLVFALFMLQARQKQNLQKH